MKKIGLIGLSEGNGHPYSFSAIINGYNEEYLKQSGWDTIYHYVRKRDISEIKLPQAQITHVWTQSEAISNTLSLACNIRNVVSKFEDMIGEVDGVIIARDDYENHLNMAKPFLESGIKVLIDKPLTIDINELKYFKEYILNGQLVSMSGMRYAIELDEIRSNLQEYGELKFIQSAVINDWEKYGIHILDAVLGILPYYPVSIEYIPGAIGTYTIEFQNNLTWTINTLNDSPKTFNINVWGTKQKSSFEINDNFSMFRRLLWRFIQLVDTGEVLYSPNDILRTVCLLIGGNISRAENRKVHMNEFSSIFN